MQAALDFMHMLSEERRLRIVMLLTRHDELCVSDLISLLAVPQYAVSHALAYLRQAGIVTCRKTSRQVFYAIAPEKHELVEQVITPLLRQFPEAYSQPMNSAPSYHRILAA